MNQLVESLSQKNILNSNNIIQVMLKVDRKLYCPNIPYRDSPQSIGYGATISAPHMHAYSLQILEPFLKPGNRVLDIGCGSGYLCTAFAHLVGSQGKVVGIDHIPELVELSKQNILKDQPQFLHSVIDIKLSDGRVGCPGEKFDAIHVGAASPKIPSSLIDQLNAPGRMIIPVGQDLQELVQVDKDFQGNVTKKQLMGVMYVPLTSKEHQLYHFY